MHAAVAVQDLQVSYYDKTVLQNVSFSVPQGAMVGIIGPNGAGKSTLLKSMLGLIPKDKGTVTVFGQSIRDVRKQIAYVPQRNDIDWNFPINVLETVLIGTYPHLGLFRRPGKKERQWAEACLETVGMQDYSRRQVGELSGGQQQRVFIARALAQRPRLFLLDEPFAGIDVNSEETILRVLRELRDEGRSIVLVHHDLSKVKEYFDHILLINGELIASGPVDVCFNTQTISRAYEASLSIFQGLEVGA